MNSSHHLGEIWGIKLDLNSTFWIPVFTKLGWKLGFQNSTSKIHLNLTLTPLLNSSHQLGEIWVLKLDLNSTFWIPVFTQSPTGLNMGAKTRLKLDFLNPSFYQVRVKTWISKLHFKTPLKLDFNSTFEPQSPTVWNLGEKTQLKLNFLNLSFDQVRVKTWISELHFKTPLKLQFNCTFEVQSLIG